MEHFKLHWPKATGAAVAAAILIAGCGGGGGSGGGGNFLPVFPSVPGNPSNPGNPANPDPGNPGEPGNPGTPGNPPPAESFSIGVKVSGLSGNLVIQNNSGDDLAIKQDGSFTFSTPVTAYNVTVRVQPLWQNCVVNKGSGQASANVTDVEVQCSGTLGKVETIAGKAPFGGNIDGPGVDARFNFPNGIALDANGTLLVADSGNNVVRAVDLTSNAVSTLTNNPADFKNMQNISAPDSNGVRYIVDSGTHKIKSLENGVVNSFAGTGNPGSSDGTIGNATFLQPAGIVLAPNNILYVSELQGSRIRKIDIAAGIVTTLVDESGSVLDVGGSFGLAIDQAGALYVPQFSRNTIAKIVLTGTNVAKLTVLAGSGQAGSDDGEGATASFSNPQSIAIDSTGNLYVTDNYRLIRHLTPAGKVSTIAGSPLVRGNSDGTGPAALFDGLYGIVVDALGTLYVSDKDNHTIRRITAVRP